MGMPGSGHSLWPNAVVKKLQGDTDMMREILETSASHRETDTHTRNVIKEYETYTLQPFTGYVLLIILLKYFRSDDTDLYVAN